MPNHIHLIHPKYRPDIDGLRAIAVMSVIFYHVFPASFPAGFIGVDIFFVISGYLISSILISSLNKHRFSILEFYSKRVRRIFPALSFVFLASLIYGWFYLFPTEYVLLGKQIASGSAFISNIVFWRDSGYFDTASELKPMLHLWSLGVEEQFYIIWPLLLFLAFKGGRHTILATLISILVLSLALNITMVAIKPTATFFLPITRFWELLIGSLLAYTTIYWGGITPALFSFAKAKHHDFSHRALNEILSWLGLISLLIAYIFINKQCLFPGWWALLPTLSAFLLIGAGAQTWLGRNILSSKVMVWIGLISYPLYLWHWPLLAFARIEFGALSGLNSIGVIVTCVLLAWLTYRWLEKPVRTSSSAWVTPLLTLLVALLGLFGFAIFKGYVSNNTDTERQVFERQFENSWPKYQYLSTNDTFKKYRSECDFLDVIQLKAKQDIPLSCYTPTTALSIFIWGDSHAQQLNYGLSKHLPADISLLQVATSGCNPSQSDIALDIYGSCNLSNQFALKALARFKPKLVILAQREGHTSAHWDELAKRLYQMGIEHVVLVGPAPHWQPDLPKIVARNLPNPPNRLKRGLDESVLALDRELKIKYQNSQSLHYLSLIDSLCNQDGCLTYLGSEPLEGITSFDYGHLTSIASDYVGEKALAPSVLALLQTSRSKSESAPGASHR